VPSRRSFLTRAAGASAAALPALALLNSSKAKAGQPKKLTGLTATLLQEIMNDEADHVKVLQNLLDDEDNPLPVPIRKPPKLDVAELTSLINDRTRLVILNSPHNPTGGVLGKHDLEQIAAAIGDRNIFVLSDEIYSRLIFDGKHYSIIAEPGFKDRTILLDGFSKSYAMTGWRMGYGVMRPDLAQRIAQLQTNSNSCTASFTQVAGVEALHGDQTSVDHMREEFQRRRDMFVAELNEIKGFSCRVPRGAFYVFPNITGTGWKSKPLADALLEEAGVACLSGTSFGEFGEGYLRFSIANSMENLHKALGRIEEWAGKNINHEGH
jgi:aspartate/methionine/tyrosine aminotransferase